MKPTVDRHLLREGQREILLGQVVVEEGGGHLQIPGEKEIKSRSQQAMEWAGSMTTITQEDKDIIVACKDSVLLNDNSPWAKREGLLSLKRTDYLQAKMMSSSSCVMVIIVPAHFTALCNDLSSYLSHSNMIRASMFDMLDSDWSEQRVLCTKFENVGRQRKYLPSS